MNPRKLLFILWRCQISKNIFNHFTIAGISNFSKFFLKSSISLKLIPILGCTCDTLFEKRGSSFIRSFFNLTKQWSWNRWLTNSASQSHLSIRNSLSWSVRGGYLVKSTKLQESSKQIHRTKEINTIRKRLKRVTICLIKFKSYRGQSMYDDLWE